MKNIDTKKYYNSEIKPLIVMLSYDDKLELIDAFFAGMMKVAIEYYDLVYSTSSQDFIVRDMETIKKMILGRVNNKKLNESIILEGNPNEPTDKFFTFDATVDFDKLICEISNCRKKP